MSFAKITLTITGKANAMDVCRLLRSIKNHEEIVEDIDYKVD